MKKLLIITAISLLFACEEQKIIGWNDFMKAIYYHEETGSALGTIVVVDDEELTEGSFGLPIIEYDDANNYVGTERGKISDSNKTLVIGFCFTPNDGYYINVAKGSDVSEAGWANNNIRLGNSIEFDFQPILADKPTITVGNEIAIIKIYEDENKTKLLATYSLRL